MRQVIKSKGTIAPAYELGKSSAMEAELIQRGKIRLHEGGIYELFSLESVNGSGEIARAGDFFKVDQGCPYPIERDHFLASHRHVEGETYQQLAKPLSAWEATEPLCPEIAFLIARKGLVLNPDTPEKYFTAPLWGTLESAAQDAVLIFYGIERDGDGQIIDASFNFVERGAFERTYTWLD